MRRRSLLLRALRWRLGASAGVLVIATVATLAAAFGPIYTAGADQTVLHTTFKQAGATTTALTSIGLIESPTAAQQGLGAERLGAQAGLHSWFSKPVLTVDAGLIMSGLKYVPHVGYKNFPNQLPPRYQGDLVWRPGVCRHLVFVAGHCPAGYGQVLLTARTAKALGTHLGGTFKAPSSPLLKVVGIVLPANIAKPYWLGDNYFGFDPTATFPSLDAFWATRATLAGLPAIAILQYPVAVARTAAQSIPRWKAAIARFDHLAITEQGMTISGQVGLTISAYLRQAALMAAIVAVVDLQLVLLCLFLLYGLVARTTEARRREVALAKLRGLPSRQVLSHGLGEPLALVTLALPLGLLLAWGAYQLLAGPVLEGASTYFSPLTLLAALAAFAGGLAATAVGARRILRRPLQEELLSGDPRPSPLVIAVGDGVAVALAVAAVAELATAGLLSGNHPNSISLFAPALLGVMVALLGIRMLPIGYRWLVRKTAGSTSVATSLAVRQAQRRPSTVRQALVLTVATGLVCFSVCCWFVAGRNRTAVGQVSAGAPAVLQVQSGTEVNFLNAVREVDPSGRHAMAAEELKSPLANQTMLAVDPRALGRIAFWPASKRGLNRARMVRWLSPAVPAPLVLTGSKARMAVDLITPIYPPPDLQFNLIDNAGNLSVADFGYLRAGTHLYTASLPGACFYGCRVTSLTPYWYPLAVGPQHSHFALSLSNLRYLAGRRWIRPHAPVDQTSFWQSGAQGAAVSGGGGSDPVFRFSENASLLLPPSVVPAPLPGVLPGLATKADGLGSTKVVSLQNFDGTFMNVNVHYKLSSLPGLGPYGYLVSLPLTLDAESSNPANVTEYVWLSAGAPAGIEHALARHGVQVLSVHYAEQTVNNLNHEGVALAYQFFLFAAASAALLAAGVVMVSLFISARRRSFELAVLRASGIPSATLLRALLVEQLLVVIPGMVLGVVSGLLSATLVLPAAPEFPSTLGLPPLNLTLPAAPLVALALILAASLFAAARIASGRVMRGADVERLRMELQ